MLDLTLKWWLLESKQLQKRIPWPKIRQITCIERSHTPFRFRVIVNLLFQNVRRRPYWIYLLNGGLQRKCKYINEFPDPKLSKLEVLHYAISKLGPEIMVHCFFKMAAVRHL